MAFLLGLAPDSQAHGRSLGGAAWILSAKGNVAVVWIGKGGKGAFLVRAWQPLELAKLCPLWCEAAAEDEGGG